jgi:hypothetical protein
LPEQPYHYFEHVQKLKERAMYHNDTTIVVSYLVYLLISVTLTVWVAARGGLRCRQTLF